MSEEYDELRAAAREHEEARARQFLLTLYREGIRKSLGDIGADAARLVTEGVVDEVLESASARVDKAHEIIAWCDVHGCDADDLTGRASWWAGIAERFDACLDEHITRLDGIVATMHATMEANASQWEPDSVMIWVGVGTKMVERLDALRERQSARTT